MSVDLNEARVLAAVVRSGSFTGASRELGIQKSGVSRKIAELETRLRTRLLQRTTRQLHLTDEGRVYFEHAARALAEMEEAERTLGSLRAEPHGRLRVTAPLSFGGMGTIVAQYLTRYPDVQVELVCTDRLVDLVDEGFDVAVRAGPLADSSLISRHLGTLPRFLVASAAYLKKRGTPRSISELAEHACLVFGKKREARWELTTEQGGRAAATVVGRFLANEYEQLREAAVAGLGISLHPAYGCWDLIENGQLKRVLPHWLSTETPIHVLYPSTQHLSSKVKAFVELLQEGRPFAPAKCPPRKKTP